MGNVARKRCWSLPCSLLVLRKEPTEPRRHHQLRRDKRCLGTLPRSDGGAWDFHYVDQFWCHRIIGFVVSQLKKYVSRRSIWTAQSYLLVLNRIFMVRAAVSPPSSRLSSELVDSGGRCSLCHSCPWWWDHLYHICLLKFSPTFMKGC